MSHFVCRRFDRPDEAAQQSHLVGMRDGRFLSRHVGHCDLGIGKPQRHRLFHHRLVDEPASVLARSCAKSWIVVKSGVQSVSVSPHRYRAGA